MMASMTGEQRARVKGAVAGAAIVVGLFGLWHFRPGTSHDASPVVATTTSSTASTSSSTSTVTTIREVSPTTWPATIGGKPAVTTAGVATYPAGGRWVEVDGRSCRWLIDDVGGATVDAGQGTSAEVPDQVADFRSEPSCTWRLASRS